MWLIKKSSENLFFEQKSRTKYLDSIHLWEKQNIKVALDSACYLLSNKSFFKSQSDQANEK